MVVVRTSVSAGHGSRDLKMVDVVVTYETLARMAVPEDDYMRSIVSVPEVVWLAANEEVKEDYNRSVLGRLN